MEEVSEFIGWKKKKLWEALLFWGRNSAYNFFTLLDARRGQAQSTNKHRTKNMILRHGRIWFWTTLKLFWADSRNTFMAQGNLMEVKLFGKCGLGTEAELVQFIHFNTNKSTWTKGLQALEVKCLKPERQSKKVNKNKTGEKQTSNKWAKDSKLTHRNNWPKLDTQGTMTTWQRVEGNRLRKED